MYKVSFEDEVLDRIVREGIEQNLPEIKILGKICLHLDDQGVPYKETARQAIAILNMAREVF